MEKLTPEDKLLGRTEPLPKTELQINAFSADMKYEVGNKEGTNTSIMVGTMVERVLPFELKQKIRYGETEIEYGGVIFKRLEPVVKTEEVKEEEETPKPKRKRVK